MEGVFWNLGLSEPYGTHAVHMLPLAQAYETTETEQSLIAKECLCKHNYLIQILLVSFHASG